MLKLLLGSSPVIVGTVLMLFLSFHKSLEKQEAPIPESTIQVSDFGLADQLGNFHNFSYYDSHKAMVLFVQGNGCPIVRNAIQEFQQLEAKFANAGIKFMMINANLQDDREKVKTEAEEFDIQLPILIDEQQLVAKMLDLRITAEVLLIDMGSRRIKYRGPVSDRLAYEAQKETAQNHYLQDAINHFLRGEAIAEPVRKTMGCAITRLSDKWADDLSYTDDIAPILIDKCVNCHQEGGIAPWAMTDYKTILGWSAMIKEVIYTKRMPPWHADKAVGHFSNDLSLTDTEIETIIAWIDGKMTKGSGPDPLENLETEPKAWALGEPDFVLDLKTERIPATGIID